MAFLLEPVILWLLTDRAAHRD